MRRWLLLSLALLVSAPADALITDAVDESPTTSPPADDPGWSHVGNVSGLTGIYLGNGWVLTAGHVSTANPELQGVFYPVVPGSDVQLHNPDNSLADLKVFRIDPGPSLPLLNIRSTTPPTNTNVTMIGRGFWRGAATIWNGYGGYLWSGYSGMRWGTNRVYSNGVFAASNWSFVTDFTKLSQSGTPYEAQGALGDSGGAVFIKNTIPNPDVWELAGVMFAILPHAGQPDQTALYGNYTYSADLSVYRAQLIALPRPECSNQVDDDGDSQVDWPADPQCTSALDTTELPDQDLDGVGDPEDNCLTVVNPDQRDTNQDGYGNLCDADLTGDGVVGLPDFGVFKSSYGKGAGNPGYNPDADLDGDDIVGVYDFGLFHSMYGQPVAPSGLSCAGTIPCP